MPYFEMELESILIKNYVNKYNSNSDNGSSVLSRLIFGAPHLI